MKMNILKICGVDFSRFVAKPLLIIFQTEQYFHVTEQDIQLALTTACGLTYARSFQNGYLYACH